MQVKVAVPLPALAENLQKKSANELEFTLATGRGAATLEAFREHFVKAGWTEEQGRELGKTSGVLIFTQGYARLTLSYFDLGLSDVDITVSGTNNVVLEPVPSKDNPPADAPKAVKKPAAPGIPGLPALPPGVELPDDVKALLQKALQESGIKPATPAQKPASKKAPR